MIPTRTELLFERSTLTVDGRPKKRTREVLMGMSKPARRDIYSRLERRFRDAVTSLRKTMPGPSERRAQSLNKRRNVAFRSSLRIPARHATILPPRRAAGGIGILRNR